MKRTLNLIACVAFVLTSGTILAQEMTKVERSKALDHLKSTQDQLMKTVVGLSKEQLNFRSSEDAWSIAQCVEHIAIAETSLFGLVQMTLQNNPDPSLRDSVAMSDDQVVGLITSRERKVKTQEELTPRGKFGSYQGSIDEFKSKRASNKAYLASTKDDLRNRYFDFPFGKVDSYQLILFMSGHTARHTDQIKEIMASPGFPGA
ncbi:MAG: DinB family protein [Cyclobacteriaceae bacterium]